MNYVSTDLHANQRFFLEKIEPGLKSGDRIFFCGDFGIGFLDGVYPERMFYEHIGEQEYTLYFIDGNHEVFSVLNSFPVVEHHGGRARQLAPNIFHLMRGEIYDFDGVTVLAMGGGFSYDYSRRTDGYDWFSDLEMPSFQERENCLANLEKCNNKVDVILTHTASSNAIMLLNSVFRAIKPLRMEEGNLNAFFDTLEELVDFKRWYFGHLHKDYELPGNRYELYECIRDMDTGKVMFKVDRSGVYR